VQRKTVTVLFCDTTGSTELGETVDPERFRALLARYFERMKAIVDRHGGSVEKFIGLWRAGAARGRRPAGGALGGRDA
jgi:class 3 adenylate cyclase